MTNTDIKLLARFSFLNSALLFIFYCVLLLLLQQRNTNWRLEDTYYNFLQENVKKEAF